MNDVAALQLFVRVVEAGSFSAAARALGMTPSNVSRQISQLETDLGMRLFHRTTRKQNLSEAGDVYYRAAKRIVTDIAAARDAVVQLADAPSGDLHITAEADLAAALIAPVLPDFLFRYPQVQVRLSMSPAIIDLVDSGVDLAVRVGHLEDSSLIARRIAMSRSQLYASPRYLARNGIPLHPKDIEQHDCLSFRIRPGRKCWRFETEDGALDVQIAGPVSAESLVFLRDMTVAGCGIAMIPMWMAREELRNGKLVPVLSDFPLIPPQTPISAVYAHNRHLAPKVRAFIDFLSERVREI